LKTAANICGSLQGMREILIFKIATIIISSTDHKEKMIGTKIDT
jgi:hypothetical protein